MRARERRAAARVDIDIRAAISNGDGTIDCRLLNMCERGFLIEADGLIRTGDQVGLAVPLEPEKVIRCTVQIRHVNAQRLGALVTEISDNDKERCLEFLRRRRSLR